MTVPSGYTDATLAAFMLAELGAVADALDVVSSALAEPINEVLLVYGETAVASCSDIAKLRKIAKVEAWKYAAKQVAVDYNFSEGGASYSRSQMQAMILQQLDLAKQDAAGYYEAYTIQTGTVEFPDNPYGRLNVSSLESGI